VSRRIDSLEDHAVALALLEALARVSSGLDAAKSPKDAALAAHLAHIHDGWSIAACVRRIETLADVLWPDLEPPTPGPAQPETREERLARLRAERRERLGMT
jgi:hypothetical protein